MTSRSAVTIAVSDHARDHVTRFRREWGKEATAALAVGLTAQQQRPQSMWPATDQLWAYHAMAVLRGLGRPDPDPDPDPEPAAPPREGDMRISAGGVPFIYVNGMWRQTTLAGLR